MLAVAAASEISICRSTNPRDPAMISIAADPEPTAVVSRPVAPLVMLGPRKIPHTRGTRHRITPRWRNENVHRIWNRLRKYAILEVQGHRTCTKRSDPLSLNWVVSSQITHQQLPSVFRGGILDFDRDGVDIHVFPSVSFQHATTWPQQRLYRIRWVSCPEPCCVHQLRGP